MAEDLAFRPWQIRLSTDAEGWPLCPHCGLALVRVGDYFMCPVAKRASDDLSRLMDEAVKDTLNG